MGNTDTVEAGIKRKENLIMDKLSLISGALFLAADIFAVAALAMPDWIVTDVGGETRLGLMQVTLICVFCGCICVTTTIVLLIATLWDRTVTPYAKWVGFVAGMSSVKVQTKCIAIHTC